jgi:hypothetical protein
MIEAELPDGRILEFPAGTSPDVVQKAVKGMLAPQPAPAKPTRGDLWEKELKGVVAPLAGLGTGVGNVALGGQNLLGIGLEKLGASRIGKFLQEDAETGKQKLQKELEPYKSVAPLRAGGGELVGEVVSTLPVGGGLAKGLTMIPGAAQKMAPLVQALRTSGMSAGGATGAAGMGARVAGGAATGGAAATLINPEDAGTGAAIGGALPMVGPLVRGTGNVASKVIGQTTGVGDEALRESFRAGRVGGETAETFTKNMRGGAEMTDVLGAAKSNLAKMNADKQAAYRSDMNALKTDKTVLAFDGIDNSVKDAIGKVTFKGQVKNEGAANYLGKAQAEIDNWKSLNPQEFHTPEGLDALKQKVGDILESIPFEQKTARSAVGDVYNGIKGEIKKQAPKYADTMKAYQEASELTKEIERALSLGNRAAADTSMRKLQSLMRNNVNTNYGNRLDLAKQLEAAGGNEIMPAIAGQALNSFTPRGLQGVAATGLGGFGIANPATLAALPLTSPRLMGEASYGLGKVTRPNALANALRQGTYRGAPVAATEGQ